MHAHACAFFQTYGFAQLFELLQKLRVEIRAALHRLPGKKFVISRRDAFEIESALIVSLT